MKNLNRIRRNVQLVLFVLSTVFIASSCESSDVEDSNLDESARLNLHETILTMRNGAPAPGMSSIGQIAINSGFNELVNALMYVDEELDAGLVNLFVNGTDQYTVFAPTDDAFMNLYSALEIDSIEELPAELVRDVLLYHVAEGRRASNSVVPKRGQRNITTLLGAGFNVNPDGSINAIGNTANIIAADISASNGIIHVIDAVILPIE